LLSGSVALRLRKLVREVCRGQDIEILQGDLAKEHVHILVSAPPNIGEQDHAIREGQDLAEADDGVPAPEQGIL
jgi:REP element-mobilizing transposase RayT